MTEPLAAMPSPSRRQVQLQRAAQASDLALRRVLADVQQVADDMLGPAADRLVVFRLEPGDEQSRLTSVDFASAKGRVTRGYDGADRAACTELHADLVLALSMCAATGAPGGLVLAVDQQLIAGYPEGHCNHWDGEPTFVFSVDRPWLLEEPAEEPYCCPGHLIPALLERYGLQAPSHRTHHDCDEP